MRTDGLVQLLRAPLTLVVDGPEGVVALATAEHPTADDYRSEIGLLVQDARFSKGPGIRAARRLFGQGLLTSEDPLHRRQRRILQPAFHHDQLQAYRQAMHAAAAQWADTHRAGDVIDLGAEMNRITLRIVGRTLFGADVDALADEVASILAWGQRGASVLRVFASDAVARLSLPLARRLRAPLERLDAIVRELIGRQRARSVREGFLGMLLDARDEDGAPLDDTQVRDEALTFFLAGHETTASALTWTFVLLAQHPDVDAAVGDEVRSASDPGGLDLVPRVVAEAMRLIPPVWMVGRQALQDVDIGGTILRGQSVLCSPYALQRDPRFWDDPLRFDPERFRPERRAGQPRFAYFPFGAGSRSCIGERFAQMEALAVVAQIAARFRLAVDVPLRLGYRRRMITQPAVSLRATLVARH